MAEAAAEAVVSPDFAVAEVGVVPGVAHATSHPYGLWILPATRLPRVIPNCMMGITIVNTFLLKSKYLFIK